MNSTNEIRAVPETLGLSQDDLNCWMEALRFLPTDPAQIMAWIEGPLKKFFPFDRVICIHGELIAGQIVVTHWLASGFSEEQQSQQTSAFETAQRGALAKWIFDRQPFYIDRADPPSYATEFEIEEMHRLDMENIAAHGILNVKANAGTYFSFAGVRPPLSNWHLNALRIVTPVLNDLFLTSIARSTNYDEQLNALSPRQKMIVRYLVAGFDNRAIAKNMDVSEKTIRNQLSEIYAVFKIYKRSELQAFLR